MLSRAARELLDEGRWEGMREGEAKGRLEGEARGQAKALAQLLERRFDKAVEAGALEDVFAEKH
jgi:predicted transposase YdaD